MITKTRDILNQFRTEHNELWMQLTHETITRETFVSMLGASAADAGMDMYRHHIGIYENMEFPILEIRMMVADICLAMMKDINLFAGNYAHEAMRWSNTIALLKEWRSPVDHTPNEDDIGRAGNPGA